MKGHCGKSPKLPPAGFRRAISQRQSRDMRPRLLLHLPRAAWETAFCLLLVVGQAFFFSLTHRTGLWLVLLAVPFGFGLGVLWFLCRGPERLLHAWISRRLDWVLAGFGLFFFHLIFYILAFSLAVSYPLSLLIGLFWGSMDLAREYMVYSVNPVFILAAGSWLRWWRTAGRHQPRTGSRAARGTDHR